METRISSMATGLIRFGMIPVFVLVGLGMLATAVVSIVRGDANGAVFVVPAIAWLAIMYLVLGKAWQARTVDMTATGLRVSGRDAELPFGDIAGVSENVFSSPELVTVRTRLGEEIRFFATYRVRFWFTSHPIVDTLRAKALAAVRAPGSEIDPELGIAPARVVRRRG